MKLYIEVTLSKEDGRPCDEDTVFEMIETELDGGTIYPQHPDADEESTYSIDSV